MPVARGNARIARLFHEILILFAEETSVPKTRIKIGVEIKYFTL
jgi:hypothetical protein